MNAHNASVHVPPVCLRLPPPIFPAFAAEAAPLIERLGLVHDPDKFSAAAPSKCFSGSYQGAAISVVTNGKCARFGVDQIGTVAAGLSTWLSVEVSGYSEARRGARDAVFVCLFLCMCVYACTRMCVYFFCGHAPR